MTHGGHFCVAAVPTQELPPASTVPTNKLGLSLDTLSEVEVCPQMTAASLQNRMYISKRDKILFENLENHGRKEIYWTTCLEEVIQVQMPTQLAQTDF